MSDTAPGRQDREIFYLDVQSLLDPENSTGRSLLIFVRTILIKFHLDQSYNLADVINEAYCRGVRLIESGQSIKNTSAWLKATAYNIIRELSREQRRLQPLESDLAEFKIVLATTTTVCEDVIDECLIAVEMAFEKLSIQDQRILRLRVVEDLSWREVGERLQANGERPKKEAALRKRGERALKNLRKNYHFVRSAESTR
ncbi:MAG: sigma-70 family RNA polymerase sigma factor [Merismopedia sp. SIO2A8]|nr:sigma-70 family RNA polymerase sigma factor [Symploca sp. SIO2B6]NET50666.1 sigma-70 family RNA polymerase sigma factor [Merismopedia sp. SIO2A8]